jgi:hypothetical protein
VTRHCDHPELVLLENGCGRCTTCGADDLPLTAEGAGSCKSCGSFGECDEGCDGEVRQPWALAREQEDMLDKAIDALPAEKVRSLVEAVGLDATNALFGALFGARHHARRIRYDGREPGETVKG